MPRARPPRVYRFDFQSLRGFFGNTEIPDPVSRTKFKGSPVFCNLI
jgi:hypothetical protein